MGTILTERSIKLELFTSGQVENRKTVCQLRTVLLVVTPSETDGRL